MVFDKTDTQLSSFINQASPEDLSRIAPTAQYRT